MFFKIKQCISTLIRYLGSNIKLKVCRRQRKSVKRFERAQIHSFMITSERVNLFKDTEDPLEGITGLYIAVEIIIRQFLKM